MYKNRVGDEVVTIGENAIVSVCTLVNANVPTNLTAVGILCRSKANGVENMK